MKKVNSIIELIGETPVIKLEKLINKDMGNVYLKLESFNPGGSIKDRAAYNMICDALKNGDINQDTVVIEPTSGNTGIGLAMVCARLDIKLIIVMPENMSIERMKLIKIYGAKIVLTKANLGMTGAIDKAMELAKEYSNSFVPLQFENSANPDAHKKTAKELLFQMDNKIDALICGVGTGGTLTGISKVLKQELKNIQIVAVEPKSSPVIAGGRPGSHSIQGIGAGFIPKNLDTSLIDCIVAVSDEEAINTSRELARREGILTGISSGATVFAALLIARKLGSGKDIIAITPDTGERYISTSMFDI